MAKLKQAKKKNNFAMWVMFSPYLFLLIAFGLIPVIMAGEDSKTLPVFVASFISNRTLDWGPMAAAATIALIPIVIFTVFIQKYLVAGLSSGAVKE